MSQADQNQRLALPWILAINVNLLTNQEVKEGRELIVEKKRCLCFFNNWERRDSRGVKITAVCQDEDIKQRNGAAPTPATLD